jgi:hypothetical protein
MFKRNLRIRSTSVEWIQRMRADRPSQVAAPSASNDQSDRVHEYSPQINTKSHRGDFSSKRPCLGQKSRDNSSNQWREGHVVSTPPIAFHQREISRIQRKFDLRGPSETGRKGADETQTPRTGEQDVGSASGHRPRVLHRPDDGEIPAKKNDIHSGQIRCLPTTSHCLSPAARVPVYWTRFSWDRVQKMLHIPADVRISETVGRICIFQ